tara:strand:+ start:949 stop:3390 length:2442 start_codon:yes stop_codon:yes gene_type:complete
MKCFLSHASADKKSYADIVVKKLGSRVEYDAKTFEEGMGNLEEILRALDRSEIFVLLISEKSLESDWVKKEVLEAKTRIENGLLARFFPLVIDRVIKHDDSRIPEWISSTYNLRPISKPIIAAKRIRERLIEASWSTHPSLKDRHEVFVGRNSLMEAFEIRIDDFTREVPIVTFASGLNGIGRKSLMKQALRKSNVIRSTYDPLIVDLSRDDSIEGFILKLADLDISDENLPTDLLRKSMGEKISVAAGLVSDILSEKERLFIEDKGCIVRYDQSVAPWFLNVIELIPRDNVSICVATAARAKHYEFVNDNRLFFLHVPELSKHEREGLFKRYSDVLKLSLSRSDLLKFSPFLTGLPEQVTYAASMIESLGVPSALSRSNEIIAFSKFRAGIYLKKYEENERALAALRFLSSFEFFSLDFSKEIEELSGEDLVTYINEFVANFVCETVGSSGSYFRINEIIRDSVIRDRLHMSEKFSTALQKYVHKFTSDFEIEHYDVSEYYIAAREALTSQELIPEKLLIPAHFVNTMKDLYAHRRYNEVIALADRVLENEDNYDQHTSQDIRYYLCQSLARNKDTRFTGEVRKINGPERDFLFGFYYRLRGRFDESLQRYNKAKKHNRTEQRAMREIVFVLTTIEDYEAGISLARENYERYPFNPFMVQAYFQCVMYTPKGQESSDLAAELLKALKNIGGPRAEEMYATLSARFQFQFGDKALSFDMVQQAINAYPEIDYPILTKLDMAIHDENSDLIEEALSELKLVSHPKSHILAKKKGDIFLRALQGDKARALRMLDNELDEISARGKERIRRRIEAL